MIYVYGRNPAALLASLSSFYPILTPHGYLEIIRILIISVDIGSYVARQSGKKKQRGYKRMEIIIQVQTGSKLSPIKLLEEVSLFGLSL